MPNTKSAKKRMKQDEKRRIRNKKVMSKLKTQIKRFKSRITEKDLDEAKKELKITYSVIDKSAKKGVIHPNNAARKKSRLTNMLRKLEKQVSTT